jgi:hypothetical protein
MSASLTRSAFLIGAVLAIALAVLLWTQECTGPRPHLVSTEVQEPASEGDPYIVRAVIENTGRGEGHVSVDFRLESADGERYEATRTADLTGHERLTISEEVFAPSGGEYRLSAKVHYPVQ